MSHTPIEAAAAILGAALAAAGLPPATAAAIVAAVGAAGPTLVDELTRLVDAYRRGEPLPEPQRVEPLGAGDLVGDLVTRLSKEKANAG